MTCRAAVHAIRVRGGSFRTFGREAGSIANKSSTCLRTSFEEESLIVFRRGLFSLGVTADTTEEGSPGGFRAKLGAVADAEIGVGCSSTAASMDDCIDSLSVGVVVWTVLTGISRGGANESMFVSGKGGKLLDGGGVRGGNMCSRASLATLFFRDEFWVTLPLRLRILEMEGLRFVAAPCGVKNVSANQDFFPILLSSSNVASLVALKS
jgi:hypothetical protein